MPGPAVDQNITLPAGDTRTLRFPVYDDAGAAPSLAGAKAYWWLGKTRNAAGADVVVKKDTAAATATLVTEVINGVSVWVLYVPLLPADTASLPPHTYYHEARVILGNGTVGTVTEGQIVLSGTITPTS